MIDQKHALPTDDSTTLTILKQNKISILKLILYFSQRAQIVNGLYEPNDEECLNPWRDENDDEELAKAVQGAAITEGEKKEGEETKAIE